MCINYLIYAASDCPSQHGICGSEKVLCQGLRKVGTCK